MAALGLTLSRRRFLTTRDRPKAAAFGEYQGKEIILKEGKYGKYVTWNNKNISLKSLKNGITLEEIIPLLTAKNPNILRELRDDLSIRKGKWGPYIFYKNPRPPN